MDAEIFEAAGQLVRECWGSTVPGVREYVILGIVLLLALWLFTRLIGLFSGVSVDGRMCVLALLLAPVLLLLVLALVRLYVEPALPGTFQVWAMPVSAGLFLLLGMIPLTGKMCSVNYLVALGAWFLTLLAAVLMAYAVAQVYDLLAGGAERFSWHRSERQQRMLPF